MARVELTERSHQFRRQAADLTRARAGFAGRAGGIADWQRAAHSGDWPRLVGEMIWSGRSPAAPGLTVAGGRAGAGVGWAVGC